MSLKVESVTSRGAYPQGANWEETEAAAPFSGGMASVVSVLLELTKILLVVGIAAVLRHLLRGAVSQLRQLCGNLKALDGGIGLTPHFGFNGFQEESLESLIPYPA